MKTIGAIGMTVLSLLLMMDVAISGVVILPAGHADLVSTDQNVTSVTLRGTIEGIDPAQRIITIQSEENRGEIQLLAFSDPTLVQGLTKGDRVVVELDVYGMAQKITKASPDQKDMSTPKKN